MKKCVKEALKKVSEQRTRRNKLLTDDEDEQTLDIPFMKKTEKKLNESKITQNI